MMPCLLLSQMLPCRSDKPLWTQAACFFSEEARLAKAADFAKEHGLGVHTAVTYQFVKTAAGLQETSCETVVYQVCFFFRP